MESYRFYQPKSKKKKLGKLLSHNSLNLMLVGTYIQRIKNKWLYQNIKDGLLKIRPA